MIDKAIDDKVSQQGAARHHLGQGQIDSGRLADMFAGPAHQSWSHVANDPEALQLGARFNVAYARSLQEARQQFHGVVTADPKTVVNVGPFCPSTIKAAQRRK